MECRRFVGFVASCAVALAAGMAGAPLASAGAAEFAYIEANGIRFAYLEAGEGPLVLLLHGYPETARSWLEVQRRIAAAGYRVVAPNLRGYAPTSSSAESDYRVGTLAADALALIEALGAEQAVLVGHDWGASAAYNAATAAPAKVRGLVALAIPHPLGIADDPSVLLNASHFIYYQFPGIRWWVARDDFSHIDRIYQSWSPSFDWASHDLGDIKATLGREGGLEGPLGYYWAFGEAEPEGRVMATATSKIGVPSLVIAGTADGAIDVSHFATAAPAFEGDYELVELENVGHFPQLEAPEATAEAILSFLARLP